MCRAAVESFRLGHVRLIKVFVVVLVVVVVVVLVFVHACVERYPSFLLSKGIEIENRNHFF